MPPKPSRQSAMDALVYATRNGATRKAAARTAGVSVATFQAWLRRGRAQEARYAGFAALIDCADKVLEARVANALLNPPEGLRYKIAALLGVNDGAET